MKYDKSVALIIIIKHSHHDIHEYVKCIIFLVYETCAITKLLESGT